MLSKCQMYTSHEQVLQSALGDAGVSRCRVYLEDGTSVLITMTEQDTQIMEIGDEKIPFHGKDIKDITNAVRQMLQQRISRVDVILEIAGRTYTTAVPGTQDNPELIASAYRTMTKQALHDCR